MAFDYRTIRSILETPILDEHKWAKLPGIAADMVFVDLEDSVPAARKVEARDRATAALSDRAWFGTKKVLARPNHLDTPWGLDDIRALVAGGADCMAYPKIQKPQDLLDVVAILRELDASIDLFAIVETAGAIVHLPAIAAVEGVVALMYGPSDLSVDAGMALYEPDGSLNRAFLFTQVQTVLTGAAFGLATTDFAIGPDLRDLDDIRRRVETSRRLGFTTMSTFYPPHIDVINDVFTPSEAERASAQSVIERYEQGLAEGVPAVLGDDGAVLLVHDYHKARRVLAR